MACWDSLATKQQFPMDDVWVVIGLLLFGSLLFCLCCYKVTNLLYMLYHIDDDQESQGQPAAGQANLEFASAAAVAAQQTETPNKDSQPLIPPNRRQSFDHECCSVAVDAADGSIPDLRTKKAISVTSLSVGVQCNPCDVFGTGSAGDIVRMDSRAPLLTSGNSCSDLDHHYHHHHHHCGAKSAIHLSTPDFRASNPDSLSGSSTHYHQPHFRPIPGQELLRHYHTEYAAPTMVSVHHGRTTRRPRVFHNGYGAVAAHHHHQTGPYFLSPHFDRSRRGSSPSPTKTDYEYNTHSLGRLKEAHSTKAARPCNLITGCGNEVHHSESDPDGWIVQNQAYGSASSASPPPPPLPPHQTRLSKSQKSGTDCHDSRQHRRAARRYGSIRVAECSFIEQDSPLRSSPPPHSKLTITSDYDTPHIEEVRPSRVQARPVHSVTDRFKATKEPYPYKSNPIFVSAGSKSATTPKTDPRSSLCNGPVSKNDKISEESNSSIEGSTNIIPPPFDFKNESRTSPASQTSTVICPLSGEPIPCNDVKNSISSPCSSPASSSPPTVPRITANHQERKFNKRNHIHLNHNLGSNHIKTVVVNTEDI